MKTYFHRTGKHIHELQYRKGKGPPQQPEVSTCLPSEDCWRPVTWKAVQLNPGCGSSFNLEVREGRTVPAGK